MIMGTASIIAAAFAAKFQRRATNHGDPITV
jgi:hypothetical protein